MLELVRIDDGSVKPKLGHVCLDEIVSDAILAFEPLFFEKGMELSSEIAPDIAVRGNTSHLKQLTDILLDKAQKYASKGGKTKVSLRRRSCKGRNQPDLSFGQRELSQGHRGAVSIRRNELPRNP